MYKDPSFKHIQVSDLRVKTDGKQQNSIFSLDGEATDDNRTIQMQVHPSVLRFYVSPSA